MFSDKYSRYTRIIFLVFTKKIFIIYNLLQEKFCFMMNWRKHHICVYVKLVQNASTCFIIFYQLYYSFMFLLNNIFKFLFVIVRFSIQRTNEMPRYYPNLADINILFCLLLLLNFFKRSIVDLQKYISFRYTPQQYF